MEFLNDSVGLNKNETEDPSGNKFSIFEEIKSDYENNNEDVDKNVLSPSTTFTNIAKQSYRDYLDKYRKNIVHGVHQASIRNME